MLAPSFQILNFTMDAVETEKLSLSKKPSKRRSRSSGVGILRSAKPLENIENVLKDERNTRNRRVSFCNTVEVKEFGLAEESQETTRKHPSSDSVDEVDIQISTPACKRQRRISDLKVKMGRLSIIPKLDKSICGDDVDEDFEVLVDEVDPRSENAPGKPAVEQKQDEEGKQNANVVPKEQSYDANVRAASSLTAACSLGSELGETDMSLTSSLITRDPCASSFAQPNNTAPICTEPLNITLTCMPSPTGDAGSHGGCAGAIYSVGQHYVTELEPVDMSLTFSPMGNNGGAEHNSTGHLAKMLMAKSQVDMGLTSVAHTETKADMSLTCVDPERTCIATNVDMSLTCVAPPRRQFSANADSCVCDDAHPDTLPATPRSTTCLNPVDMSLISSAEQVRSVSTLRHLHNQLQGIPLNYNQNPATEESFAGAVADEMDTRGSADMDFTCLDDTVHSRSIHEVPPASSIVSLLQRPQCTISTALCAHRPPLQGMNVRVGPTQICLEELIHAHNSSSNSTPSCDGHVISTSSRTKEDPEPALTFSTTQGLPSNPTQTPLPSTKENPKQAPPAYDMKAFDCVREKDANTNLKDPILNSCPRQAVFAGTTQEAFSFSENSDVPHTALKAASHSESNVETQNDGSGDGQEAAGLEEEPWTEIVAEEIIDDDQYIVSASHVVCPENTTVPQLLHNGYCPSQVTDKEQALQSMSVVCEPPRTTQSSLSSVAQIGCHPDTQRHPSLSKLSQPQVAQQQNVSGRYQQITSVAQQDMPSEPDKQEPSSSTRHTAVSCSSALHSLTAMEQSYTSSLPSFPHKGKGGPTAPMQHCNLPSSPEHHDTAPLLHTVQDQISVFSGAHKHSSCTFSGATSLHELPFTQNTTSNQPTTHDWLHPASSVTLQMKETALQRKQLPSLSIQNEQTGMVQMTKDHPNMILSSQKQPSVFQGQICQPPVKQMEQPSVSVKQMEQPSVSVKQMEQPSVSVKQMEQPSMSVKQMEQLSLSMKQLEQPSVSVKKVEQSSISIKQMEQPSVSVKQMEQPLISMKQIEQSLMPMKHTDQSVVPVKLMEQPSAAVKQVEHLAVSMQQHMDQSPVSWEHLQSALRQHLSSANNGPILPLDCTFSKPNHGQRKSVVSLSNGTNTSIGIPPDMTPQTKPSNLAVSATITKAPRPVVLPEGLNDDRSNWLQTSALDYSCPLMEESCDSPSFAIRQRQHECSSNPISKEVSLCVTDAEVGEDLGAADGFDLDAFQENLADLQKKLLTVLKELSSRWKAERSQLMQEAILHLFLSASIYLGGIDFLREYGISSGLLSSEYSSAVAVPVRTEHLGRVQWLQKMYTEVKQLHERTVSVIKRAPRIYPCVLVVWSENLVEVKLPSYDALLEIQLETKVDVMKGVFLQNITEVHWGSTAALKPANMPKPSNADNIIKVVEKITKRNLFSDHNEVTCV